MIRNKAVTKLKLAEFYCLKVLEITGNFLEAIAFNAIFGEDYEPRTRDLMRVKRRGAMPHGGRSNQQSFPTIFIVILEKSELFLEILS